MTRTISRALRLARRANLTTRLALVLAVTVLSAAACGGDSATGATNALVGTYSLQQVSQKGLPVEVYRGGFYDQNDQRSYEDFVITMTGGTLQLDDAGAYHTTLNYELLKDGTPEVGSLRAWGSYEVRGNQIFLLRDNGTDTGSGTVTNGSVTLMLDVSGKDENKAYTFTK